MTDGNMEFLQQVLKEELQQTENTETTKVANSYFYTIDNACIQLDIDGKIDPFLYRMGVFK